MAKYDAFGTQLKMGNGTFQVETATVVGTITGSGNATFTITSTGMAGTPLAISVAVLVNDTPSMVAAKARATIGATAAVTAMYHVGGSGAEVVLTRKTAVANVADLNIAYTNNTCTGLTPDATSDNTVVGGLAEVFTTIAQVKNISGPGMSLDVEDVTTHDSTGSWEEVVATVLRSGEVTLDLVWDPASATHGWGIGLLAVMPRRATRNFQALFPDTGATTWSFAAEVTGFEPDAPHDGALTASVSLKLTGSVTLA
jgi:predicted secreted protein